MFVIVDLVRDDRWPIIYLLLHIDRTVAMVTFNCSQKDTMLLFL